MKKSKGELGKKVKEGLKEFFSRFGIISGITLVTIAVVFGVNFGTGWGPGGNNAPGGVNAPKPASTTGSELPTTSTGGSSSTSTSDGTVGAGSYTTNENGQLVDQNGNPAPAGLTGGGTTSVQSDTGEGTVSGSDLTGGAVTSETQPQQ